MRRRLTVLVAVALMMFMTALSGVALAQPVGDAADRQCLNLARQTIGFGPNFNPANYTFIGGDEGIDLFTYPEDAEGSYVFCGFGGTNSIQTLDEGDVFLGGAGTDSVRYNHGTFYGGEGNDWVQDNYVTGTFYGGEGNDNLLRSNYGTFYGGEGTDSVHDNQGAIYDVENE